MARGLFLHRWLNAHLLYPIVENMQKRDISSKLRDLYQDESLEPTVLLNRQRQQLLQILKHAQEHVPYYRNLFAKNCFVPENTIQDLNYIKRLPFLTKDIIHCQGERLIADNFDRAGLHIRKTGGSTGPATSVYYSQKDLDWTAAVNLYVVSKTGKKRYHTEIHFASRFPEQFPLKDRIKEFIKCQALNRINIFTDTLSDDDMEQIYHRIKTARPYLVHCHPSKIYALANYVERKKYTGKNLFQVFESTGETLDSQKRNRIAMVFGCDIFNRYGSAEFGVIAYEIPTCRKLGMQILPQVAYAETCESDCGRKELVLTGLLNYAMPLIRYKTGDLAELAIAPSGLSFLSHIHGRIHDMVNISGRDYPTDYFQDLFNRIGGIDQFQFVKSNSGKITLRIVLSDPTAREHIARKIKTWWQGDIQPEFISHSELYFTGWQDKFRYVVSSLKSPTQI